MKKAGVLGLLFAVFVLGCTAKRAEMDSNRHTPHTHRAALHTIPELRLLKLPQGFHIGVFADGLEGPRMMALSPDGRVFVTEMDGGRITILADTHGSNYADQKITYADGLNEPHGIAFHNGYLYVAETNRVIRFPFKNGDTKGDGMQVVVPVLPSGAGHSTRTIAFGPDGKMYISVGSSCNVCIERDPHRAAVLQCNLDGSDLKVYAAGLRNSVGLAFRPGTNELWATENGRDNLGDNLPPEEINIIRSGGFYGWPYAYGDRVPDPEFGRLAPQRVRNSIPPYIKMQAHSAPLGLAFYTGNMFPAAYKNSLFVAFHGSWNRSVPTGYKVVRFPVDSSGKVGNQENFISGWLQNSGAWGRPVGLLVGKNGELLISDDTGGRIFVVTYDRGLNTLSYHLHC